VPLQVCNLVGDIDANRCVERQIRMKRKAQGTGR